MAKKQQADVLLLETLSEDLHDEEKLLARAAQAGTTLSVDGLECVLDLAQAMIKRFHASTGGGKCSSGKAKPVSSSRKQNTHDSCIKMECIAQAYCASLMAQALKEQHEQQALKTKELVERYQKDVRGKLHSSLSEMLRQKITVPGHKIPTAWLLSPAWFELLLSCFQLSVCFGQQQQEGKETKNLAKSMEQLEAMNDALEKIQTGEDALCMHVRKNWNSFFASEWFDISPDEVIGATKDKTHAVLSGIIVEYATKPTKLGFLLEKLDIDMITGTGACFPPQAPQAEPVEQDSLEPHPVHKKRKKTRRKKKRKSGMDDEEDQEEQKALTSADEDEQQEEEPVQEVKTLKKQVHVKKLEEEEKAKKRQQTRMARGGLLDLLNPDRPSIGLFASSEFDAGFVNSEVLFWPDDRSVVPAQPPAKKHAWSVSEAVDKAPFAASLCESFTEDFYLHLINQHLVFQQRWFSELAKKNLVAQRMRCACACLHRAMLCAKLILTHKRALHAVDSPQTYQQVEELCVQDAKKYIELRLHMVLYFHLVPDFPFDAHALLELNGRAPPGPGRDRKKTTRPEKTHLDLTIQNILVQGKKRHEQSLTKNALLVVSRE
jgi:hypothetical protein